MQTGRTNVFEIDLATDLRKWRAFVAIAELGSLTRAALFLDSTQSLLSRQLNALERECGARLFVRTGRGVKLSDVGVRLLPQVKSLLESARKLELDIRGEASGGRVALGSLPSGIPLVTELFDRSRRALPNISLEVSEGSNGQIEEWLANDRVDIAILNRYGPAIAERERSLATVHTCLVGAPGDRFTSAGEVPLDAMHELPLVLPRAPDRLRAILDAGARRRGISLAPAIETDSLTLQKSLVARKRLYTVLPTHAVWTELRDKRLQAARIVDLPVQCTIAMAMSKSKGLTPAVSAVATVLLAIADEMVRDGLWVGARRMPAEQR